MPASNQHVQEQYQHLKRYYASAHAHMRDVERMVLQDYTGLIDVPYEVRIFRSSTSANIVSGYRNQIRTHEPTVNFSPYGLTKKALKHASLMQRWGYSMLLRERTLSFQDPVLQNALDLIERGASCKKIIVDVDHLMDKPPTRDGLKMEEWESRGFHNWPFRIKAIDPLSVFPFPSSTKDLPGIIERQVRYASEIKTQYPHWIDPKEGKGKYNPARRVEWLEYWTPELYIVEADGELVFEKENPYGFVPYIFEWAGMGRDHNDGDPKHLAINILSEILGELEEEVRLKTAISVQTQMHVFPPILTVEDPKKVAKQFGVGPGKVIKHLPGFPPVYMEYPAPNENMYRFLEAIQQNIQRVAGAALRGSRDSSVQFGVLQAQLVGQELTNISTIRAVLDRMGARTLNMMARMMNVLDINMAIEGSVEPATDSARVSGKDFTHYNFEVDYEAVDPAENDRMLLVGEALRRAGDISRHTFHKKYAKHIIEDPDFEAVLIYSERVLEQLIEQGALMGVVLSEDVLEQLSEEALATAEDAQGAVQSRVDETVPEGTRLEVQQMEQLSGRPGSMNAGRQAALEGFENARPG